MRGEPSLIISDLAPSSRCRDLLPGGEKKQGAFSQSQPNPTLENFARNLYMAGREDDLGHQGDSMRDGPVNTGE
ncbi:hypothetical protein RS75_16970 [Rhizobium nepotum 39/7]|jgi:hypothetical protein|uniref:Uncharacterized protein n=1 Tax=Rhizobium nepotum 39/7 TaxID=1368418 RepID=A0ABR5CPB1_9HYPH|nr:hypothetical protein RS75_16970 [Rhizobium nepotum 39/7]